MKSPLLLLLIVSLLIGCTPDNTTKDTPETQASVPTVSFPDKLASSTIYEVNIRQYTPEGTFIAFAKHLPKLKELGIDMIWLMPIHPISAKNRKGSLGSYYAPADYTKVNPEFGTIEDFKKLVQEAHNLGFSFILDWVPNHTGRDHPWVTEHPDYYIRDEKGDVTYESMSPTDVWWDTALLNHYNPDTRKAMVAAMKFWVTETNIDGFRLDHGCGDKIPLYLWEEARAELDPIKDLFWLAECDQETFILDGSYAGEMEYIMTEIFKEKKTAKDLAEWIEEDMFTYGRTHYRMTYTTNHDKNSWNGTVFERFGDGHQTFAAFVFTAYGFPLIYNGQEVGINKRLLFFEKDSIDWSDPKGLLPFYKSLVKLHKENPALWAGADGGMFSRINEDENTLAFQRAVEGNRVIGLFNLSKDPQTVSLTDPSVYGAYSDYFTGKPITLSAESVSLDPWQYLVLVDKN